MDKLHQWKYLLFLWFPMPLLSNCIICFVKKYCLLQIWKSLLHKLLLGNHGDRTAPAFIDLEWRHMWSCVWCVIVHLNGSTKAGGLILKMHANHFPVLLSWLRFFKFYGWRKLLWSPAEIKLHVFFLLQYRLHTLSGNHLHFLLLSNHLILKYI